MKRLTIFTTRQHVSIPFSPIINSALSLSSNTLPSRTLITRINRSISFLTSVSYAQPVSASLISRTVYNVHVTPWLSTTGLSRLKSTWKGNGNPASLIVKSETNEEDPLDGNSDSKCDGLNPNLDKSLSETQLKRDFHPPSTEVSENKVSKQLDVDRDRIKDLSIDETPSRPYRRKRLQQSKRTKKNLYSKEGAFTIQDNRNSDNDGYPYFDKNESSVSGLSSSFPMIPHLESVYALALYRRPAFPGFYQILQIPDQDVLELLIQVKEKGSGYIGGFMSKTDKQMQEETVPGSAEMAVLRRDAGSMMDVEELHETGTLLSIVNVNQHAHIKGGQVIVMPHRRIQRKSWNDNNSVADTVSLNNTVNKDSMEHGAVSQQTINEGKAINADLPVDGSQETQHNENVLAIHRSNESIQRKSEELKLVHTRKLRHHNLSRQDNSRPFVRLNQSTGTIPDFGIGETTRMLKLARSESVAASSSAIQFGISHNTAAIAKTASPHLSMSSSSPVNENFSHNDGGSSITALPCIFVSHLDDDLTIRFDTTDELKAIHLEIVATIKELLNTSYFYKEHFDQVVRFHNLDFPSKLTDLVAGMSFAKRDELQSILHELDMNRRMWLVLEIVKKDLEFSKLQNRVRIEVEEKLTKEQKKYVLNEQLKYIKRELGIEKDDKQSIIQSFRDCVEKKTVPKETETVINHELNRLSSLEVSSAEFNICRTYLEWLTQLPWNTTTNDNEDINKATEILDADHYGLQDVKDRLLEFIAVNILKKDAQGKIICLVGPPGVGKTSVGKSIARALDRKFYRFSLGGLYDVAELRGHRRTYVSAMPGKLIQALRQTQTFNPVILLDEIDKLGKDFRGDPASALLEILDPQQNSTFRDHYLDVPVDLSRVLFVCTANATDTIPSPLLDRMEIVRIAGYVKEEKMQIAKQYLIPQVIKDTGVTEDKIELENPVLEKLVKDYAREAGVRNLLKYIEKIFRKVALQIVRKSINHQLIDMANLHSFVGQPPFQSQRLFAATPPGVVMGLAWTQMGGATLFVEAQGRILPDNDFEHDVDDETDRNEADVVKKEKTRDESKSSRNKRAHSRDINRHGQFRVTGQLGGVMNESCQIAMSFAKYFLSEFNPDNRYLDDAEIHLHVPEGATPKDGPSAGITMATALISLALRIPVIPDLAMTGELTLTGKVIKIGGVKEKVIAARRENVKILVFPLDNLKDFEELADNIKAGLTVHFVECYDDLFNIVFPTLANTESLTVASKIPNRPCVTMLNSNSSD